MHVPRICISLDWIFNIINCSCQKEENQSRRSILEIIHLNCLLGSIFGIAAKNVKLSEYIYLTDRDSNDFDFNGWSIRLSFTFDYLTDRDYNDCYVGTDSLFHKLTFFSFLTMNHCCFN